MRFAGRLELHEEAGSGLPVVVELNQGQMTVTEETEVLGSWEIDRVSAERITGDRFALTVGDEELVFVADDPLEFAYTAMPLMDQGRGGRPRAKVLGLFRSWLEPGQELPQAPPAAVATAGRAALAAVPDIGFLDWAEPAPAAIPEPAPAASGPEHCAGTKTDGQPCRSPIVAVSGYCFAHDPQRVEEHRRASSRGGRGRSAPRFSSPMVAEIYDWLVEAMAEVRAGDLDPRSAAAVAELARAVCLTLRFAEPDVPHSAPSDPPPPPR